MKLVMLASRRRLPRIYGFQPASVLLRYQGKLCNQTGFIHTDQYQQLKHSATHISPATGDRLSSGSPRPLATMGPTANISVSPPSPSPPASPLSILPLSVVARSFFIATVSSSRLLLPPALAILSLFANSKSGFLNPDRNPLVGYAMRQTVYAQFCAGETPAEVHNCVQNVKDLGYSGVILGYAREVVMDEGDAATLGKGAAMNIEDVEKLKSEIIEWKDGTLATVDLAGKDGFVAIKFSGAGKDTLQRLLRSQAMAPTLEQAMVEICERAKERGVRLLIDAEQQAVQPMINEWTMEFQRRYNKSPKTGALVYNTYQAYLRSTPSVLARHMAIAQSQGFTLGIKLVRGAYRGTEPCHLIWQTKEETDGTYDGLAEALIKGKYNDVLKQTHLHSGQPFPDISLVLASHNRESIQRAVELRNEATSSERRKFEMSYGQLYGMADDISCDLVQRAKAARSLGGGSLDAPMPYKAVVWGTVGECAAYLLRRGQENKDAVARTLDTRKAMAQELRRRLLGGRI